MLLSAWSKGCGGRKRLLSSMLPRGAAQGESHGSPSPVRHSAPGSPVLLPTRALGLHPARSALCSMLGSGSSSRTLIPSFSPNVNAHNPLHTGLPLEQGESREAVLCTPCYTCPYFSRQNAKALFFVPGLGRASRSTGTRAILPRQHEGCCLAASRFASPAPAPPVALLGCPPAAAAAALPPHSCEDVSHGLLQPLS